ncbi:uroporphyrinogen decarboxylase [Candidatus Aerophobetes bacterium]|uniref:Uroporphyrinogen decarboxylase n=1 Tax=Aerophobetes bacterium TaxID=2030807 RepID=A0A2A4X4W3_UNCAE|nr:MAG: uroporphyrinogen decarboxylase [Candidatus Aerophobetes bacterium]
MSIFLNALACQNSAHRPPIWIMRQAGRYAPSYQEIKKKYSLNQMFQSPELIEQITLMPLHDLNPDAAILFADILHIPTTLGFDVNFPQGGGIMIDPLIDHEDDFKKSQLVQDPREKLSFVFKAIRSIKQRIDVPLIGFAGGPFTVATYLFKDKAIKKWMVKAPNKVHALLQTICDQTIIFLKEQIKAGVDAIQIFESWASLLTEQEFTSFAYPYLKQIFEAISGVPTLFFSRSTHLFLDQIIKLNPSGISFDEFLNIKKIDALVPKHIAIQGNLNPYILYGTFEQIATETDKMLLSMQHSNRYIVNLGHGIMRDIPFENAQFFTQRVKDFTKSLQGA